MISLDQHKETLNQIGIEMLQLCHKQLINARDAFFDQDNDLAEEVVHTENRVNALELKIDRDCERFIALHNPVAGDLRFVLAILKINFNLERIGDYASGISGYIVESETTIAPDILKRLYLPEMFSAAVSMFDDISDAYIGTDTKRARKVFKKDKSLDKYNKDAFQLIEIEIRNNPEQTAQYLLLFSIFKKLERIGDHITNIAEEIIFIREAEVVKHRKKKG